MKLSLRHATENDSQRISDILIDSRRVFMPYAPLAHTEKEVGVWVSKILIPTSKVTVATLENKVIGIVAVTEEENITWIEQMYVDPKYVNKGIGTFMLNTVIQSMSNPIRLFTFQENSGARRLYERHGFKAIEFSNGEHNEESCPDVLYELQVQS